MKKSLENKLVKLVDEYCRIPKHIRHKGKAVRCWKTNSDLTDLFGLVSDDNEQNLGFCRINFDWNIQKWYVYI